MPSELRRTTRYITGIEGAATKPGSARPESHYFHAEGFNYTRMYAVDTVPPNLNNDCDVAKYLSSDSSNEANSYMSGNVVVGSGGVNFIQADLAPGGAFPWHWTKSIDYVTIVEGQIELEIRNSSAKTEKLLLHAGDSVVQRAAYHRWINPSLEDWARMAVTTIACIPPESLSREVGDEHLLN